MESGNIQVQFFCLLMLILTSQLVVSQTECPLITAPELGDNMSSSSTGLIVAALAFASQGGGANDIQLVDYNVVCLAQGTVEDRYRMVSVIASYFLDGATTVTTNQFHFQCVSGAWSITVLNNFDNSVTDTAVVGNLTTPVRRDCRICVDITGTGFSAAEHCVGEYLQLC